MTEDGFGLACTLGLGRGAKLGGLGARHGRLSKTGRGPVLIQHGDLAAAPARVLQLLEFFDGVLERQEVKYVQLRCNFDALLSSAGSSSRRSTRPVGKVPVLMPNSTSM